MKNTALSAIHLRQGAKMGEFQGWNLPLQFTDSADEHHAVRTAAGLFDVGFLGRIDLSGSGAGALLQKLFTRNIDSLPDGHAIYGLFCNENGGIIDASLVLKPPQGKDGATFLVTVSAATSDALRSWLAANSTGDVKIADRTAELAQFAVQGPQADSVLERSTGARRRKIRQKQVREIEVFGVRSLVSRTGYTGERGYEIILPADKAIDVWNSLLAAGRELGLLACGMTCRDILRLEAGYVLSGSDISEARTPVEAGLLMIVDPHKEFVGKEAILQQKKTGTKERLIGFELFDKGIPRPGSTIYSENREIGAITSANHSYYCRRDIGLGYVVSRYALAGQEIEIEMKDREIAAKVLDLPFYKRK